MPRVCVAGSPPAPAAGALLVCRPERPGSSPKSVLKTPRPGSKKKCCLARGAGVKGRGQGQGPPRKTRRCPGQEEPEPHCPAASFTSLSAQESPSLTKIRMTTSRVLCCPRICLQTQAQARGHCCGRPHARRLYGRLRRSWAVCRTEAASTEIINSTFFWSTNKWRTVSVTGTPLGPKYLSPTIPTRRQLGGPVSV